MLEIRDLHFRYPGAKLAALQQVSISAARGQVLGLLGPNGAGKTTLIGQLAGTLKVQQGSIKVDGVALAQLRASRPTEIAVAPQEYAFYPMLTVAENLDCFAGVGGLRGVHKASRIDECVAFAQLQSYRSVLAQKLSGGLKRRLNLSIALLHRPALILFDEPTVGVDPQSRAFLLDAIKQLAQQGKAVIYTSHYMEEVQAIADRIAVLDHGKVLCQGTLDELLAADPALSVEVSNPDAQSSLMHLLAEFGAPCVQGNSVLLPLPDASQLPRVLQKISSAGLQLRQARFAQIDLGQLFLRLTDRSLRD